MSRYLRRPSLAALSYQPGEQPPADGGWIKLNTNEAPLPPSPRVAAAVAASAEDLRLYPDPRGEPLRSALAEHHGVRPEQVLVGNGADDVLACCFRAFVSTADEVVQPEPSYSLLATLAAQHGARTVPLPLATGARLPTELATRPGRLRFVVNPNAPTGVWMPPAELEGLLGDADGVVAIDEAYGDFSPASCLPLLPRHPSWLVVRSFSKSYALAGLRVGYAVGSPELIADLEAVKASYPVGRCAIAGALAALRDQEHHRRLVSAVRTERRRLSAELDRLGWETLPSEANFVFSRPPGGDAAGLAASLRTQRILVRHLPDPGPYGSWLRITVGTPEQTDRLLEALASG